MTSFELHAANRVEITNIMNEPNGDPKAQKQMNEISVATQLHVRSCN